MVLFQEIPLNLKHLYAAFIEMTAWVYHRLAIHQTSSRMLLLARVGLSKTLAEQHNTQNTTIYTNTSINVKATAENENWNKHVGWFKQQWLDLLLQYIFNPFTGLMVLVLYYEATHTHPLAVGKKSINNWLIE